MATRVEPGTPSTGRPTGTVTFLFSDIEGSTERWDRDRAAMAAALTRHDAVMRGRLEAHGAYVFKTVGDAFCAAFNTALDAAFAAVDAQRALAAENFSAVNGLSARIALHTGTAEEREGDYFGTNVNRVARLLAIGHGGQILVSGATAELLRDEMPAEIGLHDVGVHRLKDLAHPEHVYQLTAPDLQETFPPLRSLSEIPNNLPRQVTSFVGRDTVVNDIANLIEGHPLVTLVGTGGVGKTRCAIQVGAELLDGSGDGVWLAELARISDPGLVASTVSRALNIQEDANRSVLETLLAYLKRKRLLLVLDNCEHVMEEARRVAAAIIQRCPDVRILATSREALNVSGEETYRIPSLAMPKGTQSAVPDVPARYGAVQLFVDRAVSVEKRFVLTEENAPQIAEICRRLDGIPLAIELAAARVKVLSPKQLAQKLDERFHVLTGGDRSALPRQQTMRATIDWSYELLSDDERALFRKLSIFAGGFTLEAAAALCSEDAIDDIVVLDRLASLVDKSLVQAEDLGNGTRYRLLESTRQYARDRLDELNEYAGTAHAHAAAFLTKAEALESSFETMPDREWEAQVQPEIENWRAALEWSISERGNLLLGQRLVGAMRWIWIFFSPQEGLTWIRRASAAVGSASDGAVVAKLDLTTAHLNLTLSQYHDSHEVSSRALERFQQLGDLRGAVEAQWALGRSCVFIGRLSEGESLLNAALDGAEQLSLNKIVCWILAALCQKSLDSDDLDTPGALYERALDITRRYGFDRMEAVITGMIAEYEFRRGDSAAALAYAQQALVSARARNDRRSVAVNLINSAAYLVASARYDDARFAAREALTLSRDNGFSLMFTHGVQHLAAVAALRTSPELQHGRHDLARAARLLGYIDASHVKRRTQREYTEEQEYGAVMCALRDAFGADELSRLMSEGSAWDEDRAVDQAMAV